MTLRYLFKTRLGMMVVALVLVLALAGCSTAPTAPPAGGDAATPGENPAPGAPPPPAAPLKVKEKAKISLPPGPVGYIDHTLSPDGRWAVVLTTPGGKNPVRNKAGLWLYPVGQEEGRVLAETSEQDYAAGRLLLRSLGWAEDNTLIFARQGTQPDGAHKGQRGLVFFAVKADGAATAPAEVAWLPVQGGYVTEVYPSLAQGAVFVHADKAIWRVPLDGAQPTALRQNLPSYDGLFYPRLSPAGTHFAYELWEPNKSGIYVLDTVTEAETCLAPRAETMSFGPQWSPDGRYLAYYTAPTKKGSTDPYDRYDIIMGEDAPLPIAVQVTIATPDGQKVAELSLPDKKLGYFTWSVDGTHLAFIAGQVQGKSPAESGELPAFQDASLYLADVTGKLTEVGSLGAAPRQIITLPAVFAEEPAVYLLTAEKDGNALWLARAGKEPLRLTPPGETKGYWSGYPWLTVGESLFLTFDAANYNPAGSRQMVQVWQDQVLPVVKGELTGFLAGRSGSRLAYLQEDPDGKKGELVIFELGQ
ncbi:MAG TPA: hypothetical protein GXX50_12535 [Firmicutes bacterium]|nr:hypothetical protein [Bacillota bacterium]